jgi:hypothetical protein
MGSTVLLLALLTQLAASQTFFDTLQTHLRLGTAETYYVLVVDASADPQMRQRWGDVRSAITSVAQSIPENVNLDVILFETNASLFYSGSVSGLSLNAFPVKPTGKFTDWGKALDLVYTVCANRKGVGIVFTVSICCVPRIDIPSPDSPFKDPNAIEWDSLRTKAKKLGQNVYFVPVAVEGGTFTYPEVIKNIAGTEKVIASNVNLSQLRFNITQIQRMVTKEILHKVIQSEIENGNLEILYSMKGDQKERLFIVSHYTWLPVRLLTIDSVAGSLVSLELSNDDKKSLAGLTIPPRDSIGPLERKHERGPHKLRWSHNLNLKGLWFSINQPDTIRMYGSFRFAGASEIEQLGLSPVVKVPVGVVFIRKMNLLLLGAGGLVVIILFISIAWSVGKKKHA